MKAQSVRLFDVFVLGPFMLWAATELKNDYAKIAMMFSGVATIGYNWNNYQIQKGRENEPRTME